MGWSSARVSYAFADASDFVYALGRLYRQSACGALSAPHIFWSAAAVTALEGIAKGVLTALCFLVPVGDIDLVQRTVLLFRAVVSTLRHVAADAGIHLLFHFHSPPHLVCPICLDRFKIFCNTETEE